MSQLGNSTINDILANPVNETVSPDNTTLDMTGGYTDDQRVAIRRENLMISLALMAVVGFLVRKYTKGTIWFYLGGFLVANMAAKLIMQSRNPQK